MGRFSGKAGEDYDLFRLTCPHLDELEGKVGLAIKEIFANSDKERIKVLEIGSGTGITTRIILHSDKRVEVVAVDNEKVMIEQIKNNLKEFTKNSRLKVVEDDALDFLKRTKNEEFDVFASVSTLHNFNQEYRKKVLGEIFRVLKKGGLFVNADKYVEDDEKTHKKWLNWQIALSREQYNKAGRPDLAEYWIRHYLEDDTPNLRMKECGAISFMRELGFILGD